MAKKKTEAPVAADPNSEWEHKDNFNTIMKAHEIMSDPEKMKHVHKLAGRHKKFLEGLTQEGLKAQDDDAPVKSISEMRSRAQKKFGKPSSNM